MDILFDLDGTLIDHKDRFYTVYQTILSPLGGTLLSDDEYWKLRRSKKSTKEILKITGHDDYYEQFIQKRTILIESKEYLRLDTLKPYSIEILNLLFSIVDIHLITLRSNRDNLEWQLQQLGIYRFFSSINSDSGFGNYVHKVRMIKELPIDELSTMIIGDTEVDILAGKELNLVTIAIDGGMREREILEAYSPDYIVSDLKSAYEVIKSHIKYNQEDSYK